MSWQPWADSIKNLGFTGGGIYGLKGEVWAQFGENGTEKFNPADITNIQQCMAGGGNPIAAPVHVGGKKQTLTMAGDDHIVGKLGTQSSVIAIKCNTCIIVGTAGSGSEPRTLFDPLSKLAESLKQSGY